MDLYRLNEICIEYKFAVLFGIFAVVLRIYTVLKLPLAVG